MEVFGKPTPEQLSKINKLSLRELTEDDVFVFKSKAAGDRIIPGRYTKISKELLEVLAQDARKGVSFMFNHNWSRSTGQGIPYGKVFDGRVLPSDSEEETVGLELERYIVRDDEQADGISGNALIKRIETGVLSDTSITFSTDTMTCSVCGNNYNGRECHHWRGGKYELDNGEIKECYVIAQPPKTMFENNNNSLYEESIVWDGAYPGATISQSKDADTTQKMKNNLVPLAEKVILAEGAQIVTSYSNGLTLDFVNESDIIETVKMEQTETEEAIERGVELMNEKTKKMLESFGIEIKEEMDLKETLEKISEALEKESVEPTDQSTGLMLSEDEIKESLGIEIEDSKEILELAKLGTTYKNEVIEEALSTGIVAMGNEFNKDVWTETFGKMDIESIKGVMATFNKQAEEKIPAGRKTIVDEDSTKLSSIPDEAYKTRK